MNVARNKNKPADIELHRLVLTKNSGQGILKRIEDLSDHDIQIVAEEFQKALHVERQTKSDDEIDAYNMYTKILSYWGIMCVHPESKRLYLGKHKHTVKNSKMKWFHCESCKTSCIANGSNIQDNKSKK